MRGLGTKSLSRAATLAAFAVFWCLISFDGTGFRSGRLMADSPLPAAVLKTGTVSDGEQDWTYYLLKFERKGKEPAFGIWFPSRSGGVRPAVMNVMPYEKFPSYDEVTPPDDDREMKHFLQTAYIYLFHDFGVLLQFGRFSKGGSIGNEVDDMIAGLEFLKKAPGIDRGRIGIFGKSWGGFEALYAAANAPEGAVPRAGVAFAPVTDFQKEMGYIVNNIPKIKNKQMKKYYTKFFFPYMVRIWAEVGFPGDYSGWTSDNILAKLKTPFLVLHDEWDTLIPFADSYNLVKRSKGLLVPVWLYHPAPLNITKLKTFIGHGDFSFFRFDSNILYTLAYTYLILRLADEDQNIYSLYDDEALADFMDYLKEYQCDRKRDMAWAASRLLDLAEPRVIMVEGKTGNSRPGAEVIAGAVNAAWGTDYNSDTVRKALSSGLPSCP